MSTKSDQAHLVNGGVNEAAFLTLADTLKAGALNVEAKLRATKLQGTRLLSSSARWTA